MKINDRLKTVGDLVDKSSTVLDIGCDHALLDIYLIENSKCKKAVASDVIEGPINQACKNIKKYKMDKKIEVRLGDGLDTYTKDIDTVIMSGLGGRKMISIILNNMECLKSIGTFILSPNNYQVDIKKFLVKHGYFIEEECLVRYNKFIYQVIKFKKGKRKYSKKEMFFGPVLLRKKGKLFNEYYARELKSREIVISLLPKSYRYKKYLLKKEIKMIGEEINKL